MLQAVVGHAEGLVFAEAAREAAARAAARLDGMRPKAAILFASFAEDDHAAALAEVRAAFDPLELVGCTSDGEATSELGFSRRSCALVLLGGEDVEFAAALAEDVAEDPEGSLGRAAREAVARLGGKPALCLAFPDGLSTVGVPLDEVLRTAVGPDLPVLGGTAGDCFALKRTWQFRGDRAVTGGAALLFLAGEVRFTAQVRCGWSPVGRKYRITEGLGNTVRRIGDLTARDFLRRYLGDTMSEMSHFPLAVEVPGGGFYLRDPLRINDDGSVSFVGSFPENAEVRFAEAGRDDIVGAAHEAARRALEQFPGRPALVLFFSCASRRHILGTRTEEEFGVLRGAAEGVPFLGFYCYGEIGPLDGRTCFFNDTFILLALGS